MRQDHDDLRTLGVEPEVQKRYYVESKVNGLVYTTPPVNTFKSAMGTAARFAISDRHSDIYVVTVEVVERKKVSVRVDMEDAL